MRFRHYLEALALAGNYKKSIFQQLVAARYMLAPSVDEQAIAAFKDLEQKVIRQHQMLQSKYDFRPTTDDPYRSMKDMASHVQMQQQQGIRKPQLRVYTGGGDHPVFSQDTNTMLRGVHDAIAHLAGNHPFSARGEYGAYSRHLKTLCNTDQMKGGKCPAAGALFTEIVAQTSCYYVYGDYVPQKAVLLPDFDWYRVGALSPVSPLNRFFMIANKDLVPTPDFNAQALQQFDARLYETLASQLNSFLKGQ
jgi:hypothetical protein